MRSFKIALPAILFTFFFHLGCDSGGNILGSAPSSAEASGTCSGGPLALAKQGSFFVNAQPISTPYPSGTGTPVPGTISIKGMYVQYQIPQAIKSGAYPVIMVHGSSHTGKTYEETPDGRMGWAEYLVRCGVPVYVVDQSGRARSGFDPSGINQAKIQGTPPNGTLIPSFDEFTNEAALTSFRFGYPTTKFPVVALDQYYAQIVPNTETSYPFPGSQNTVDALALLLDRIGPAVVVVHSQSGAFGIGVAIARPGLVKALVSVEPVSCSVPPANISVFTQVPLLTIFGDFFNNSPATEWPGNMSACVNTVNNINAAGGIAKNIHLPTPPYGITGNSHMLMMDMNNLEIADIILAWLANPAR
jgi:pimeloyl-ACP methyl ester carboxylesterase